MGMLFFSVTIMNGGIQIFDPPLVPGIHNFQYLFITSVIPVHHSDTAKSLTIKLHHHMIQLTLFDMSRDPGLCNLTWSQKTKRIYNMDEVIHHEPAGDIRVVQAIFLQNNQTPFFHILKLSIHRSKSPIETNHQNKAGLFREFHDPAGFFKRISNGLIHVDMNPCPKELLYNSRM
ncbi:hypothetical protein D3C81_1218240 [compost metagenome]